MNKIDYINKVNERFENAENHGNGNNWWYPIANRVAYDVKMVSFGDVETLREYLTPLQDDYYTDDMLQQYINEEQEEACNLLIDDILEFKKVEDVYFAGRSGGWIEVQYTNNLDNDIEKEDIQHYYKLAKELEKEEEKVKNAIKNTHQGYNKYVDTPEYYKDIANSLLTSEEIKEVYIEQGGKLLEKADKLN